MQTSFYRSQIYNPYENLATEQCLLETLPEDEVILYLWQNDRTVVIGRNQDALTECRVALLEAEGGHLARRPSGGGAVYHDLGNLCFTFLAKEKNYDQQRHTEVIRRAIASFGIDTEVSGRNDLLAQGLKFSGNAYYSNKNGRVHHGTLLVKCDVQAMARYLSPSSEKLAVRGVQSVRSRVVNLSSLSDNITVEGLDSAMCAAFTQVYGQELRIKEEPDRQLLERYTAQFADPIWRFWDPFLFTQRQRHRFSFGELDLYILAEEERIRDVRVATDANDPRLAQAIETALRLCPTEKTDIIAAFRSLAECWPQETAEIIQSIEADTIIFGEG